MYSISGFENFTYRYDYKGFDTVKWSNLLKRAKGSFNSKNINNLKNVRNNVILENLFTNLLHKKIKEAFWSSDTLIVNTRLASKKKQRMDGLICDDVFYRITGIKSMKNVSYKNMGIVFYICEVFKIDIDEIYKELENKYGIVKLMEKIHV